MTLDLRDLSKRYPGGPLALDRVTLTLPDAAYTCIMGASGSGKTTLLRLVAGLEHADAGTIHLAGQRLDPLPPERRPVHTVFQGYALFPHLDVAANVGFAPRLAGERGPALAARVAAALQSVGLDPAEVAARRPAALSGGQQQRVALARALAGAPRLILLDEPLAALDRPLRADLRRMLARAQEDRRIAFLHVTHDPEEAMALADHLVLLDAGRVLAAGPPADLYARPPSLAAGRLLGDLLPLPGPPGRYIRPERLSLESPLHNRSIAAPGPSTDMSPRTSNDSPPRRPARLLRQRCLGDRWELEVTVDGAPLIVRAPAPVDPAAPLTLTWRPADELPLGPP